MSSCAIMQPTYLPWAGYFNLMSRVDKFVFLDDVQFQKRTWHARNRILLQGNEYLLTIPTNKSPQQTKICDVKIIDNDRWQKKHWQTIKSAYEKAPYGKQLLDLLGPMFSDMAPEYLGQWTSGIIKLLAECLELECETFQASDLGCEGRRSDHLLAICKLLNCNNYVSPEGSREYLREDDFEGNSDVSLEFQAYNPGRYPQLGRSEFLSHLSVIDVIANTGKNFTSRYIRGEHDH